MSDTWLSYKLLGKFIGANMNTTADQIIILVPSCIITDIIVTNASTSLTTAAGGVYSAAAKGGTAFVAATQAYATLTLAARALKLTIANGTAFAISGGTPATPAQVYFALTTAQGGAATADIYVVGIDQS